MAFGRKAEAAKTKTKPAPFVQTPAPVKKRSLIGRSLRVKGGLFSDEEVLIEGTIEGKINVKNLVVVGRNGVVNADIDADEVIIEGTVNGNVRGHVKVEIVPDGVLNGNIISPGVKLDSGAVFKGSIDMTPVE